MALSQLSLLSILTLSTLSSFIQCPYDHSACTDVKCGDAKGAERAGFTCQEWPFYSGGFAAWDNEAEFYDCLETADRIDQFEKRHSWCTKWSTYEVSGDEVERGNCWCSDDDTFTCTAWLCIEIEGGIGEYIDVSFDATNTTACGTTSGGETVWCPARIDKGHELEVTNCWCTNSTEARSGNTYCNDWYCEEYDITSEALKNGVDTSKDVEREEYHCKSKVDTLRGTTDNNGEFCWGWKGDIISDEEWEVAECWCTEDSSSNSDILGTICLSWECSEIGMGYRHNGNFEYFWLGFLLWDLLLGIGLLVLLGWLMEKKYDFAKYKQTYLCCYSLYFLGLSVVTHIHAGFACFFIWFIFQIIGGGILYVKVIKPSLARDDERKRTEAELRKGERTEEGLEEFLEDYCTFKSIDRNDLDMEQRELARMIWVDCNGNNDMALRTIKAQV